MNSNTITTPLDNFYKWENQKSNNTFLIQPIEGKYIEYTKGPKTGAKEWHYENHPEYGKYIE